MDNTVYDLVKDDFPEPERMVGVGAVVDFQALALGRPPKSVESSLAGYGEDWQTLGLDAWSKTGSAESGWWELAQKLGKHIEVLLKAAPGTCTLVPNVTHVIQQLLSAPEFNKPNRRKVIVTSREFPTVYDCIHNFNQRFINFPPGIRHALGLQMKVADMVLDEIDDETAIVFLPHVSSLTGELLQPDDIKAIVRKADQCGAIVVLDGSQAIGSTEINVQDLGVHVYMGTLLKQGCGGPGNGYVYLRPDVAVDPTGGGWAAVNEPFNYDADITRRRPPNSNPLRRMFGTGTPAVSPMYHATKGLEVFERVGYDKIVADVRAKALWMIGQIRDAGLPISSPTDEARASGLIALRVKDGKAFKEKLVKEEGVKVLANGDLVRAAPHVYLSVEEVQRGTQALIDIHKAHVK